MCQHFKTYFIKPIIAMLIVVLAFALFQKVEVSILKHYVDKTTAINKKLKNNKSSYYEKSIHQLTLSNATVATSNDNTTLVKGVSQSQSYDITVKGFVPSPKNSQVTILADKTNGIYFATRKDVDNSPKLLQQIEETKSQKNSLEIMVITFIPLLTGLLIVYLFIIFKLIQFIFRFI